MQALVLGFCSSGYDFAIASSRPHLAMCALQIAMRFVGNYALRGLSPQTDGMPVIHRNAHVVVTNMRDECNVLLPDECAVSLFCVVTLR